MTPVRSVPRLAIAILSGFLLLPAAAAAQGAGGVRAGISVDPDQFYVGGHYETTPLVDQLRFRPNIEIGFGDDLTLTTLNFEFTYGLPLRGQPWDLYVGGGPAVNFYNFDERDDGETEGGFNVLLGVQHARGLFFELKVGAGDSPDLKFGVGYSFR